MANDIATTKYAHFAEGQAVVPAAIYAGNVPV